MKIGNKFCFCINIMDICSKLHIIDICCSVNYPICFNSYFQ